MKDVKLNDNMLWSINALIDIGVSPHDIEQVARGFMYGFDVVDLNTLAQVGIVARNLSEKKRYGE